MAKHPFNWDQMDTHKQVTATYNIILNMPAPAQPPLPEEKAEPKQCVMAFSPAMWKVCLFFEIHSNVTAIERKSSYREGVPSP
jgi:hypothetical protein